MNLALSEEQQDLQATFRTFFRREVSGDRVRAAEPLGFDEALWRSLVELGAVGVGIATERGGSGGGMVEAALLAEQSGGVVAPVPFVDSVVVTRLLDRLDTDAATELLGGVLAGDVRAALAPLPIETAGRVFVPAGAVADVVIVHVAGALQLLRTGVDVAIEHVDNTGSQPWARGLTAAGGGSVLAGASDAAHAMYANSIDEWRALQAAALVGLASGALTLAVDYTKDRHQFGVPIATFQAVAHGLADVATLVDGARLLAYKAAWALEESEAEAGLLALMAFEFASEVATTASARSLHYHGGYGFMREYDVQLYYRRAAAWSTALGRPTDALDELADRLWPTEHSRST